MTELKLEITIQNAKEAMAKIVQQDESVRGKGVLFTSNNGTKIISREHPEWYSFPEDGTQCNLYTRGSQRHKDMIEFRVPFADVPLLLDAVEEYNTSIAAPEPGNRKPDEEWLKRYGVTLGDFRPPKQGELFYPVKCAPFEPTVADFDFINPKWILIRNSPVKPSAEWCKAHGVELTGECRVPEAHEVYATVNIRTGEPINVSGPYVAPRNYYEGRRWIVKHLDPVVHLDREYRENTRALLAAVKSGKADAIEGAIAAFGGEAKRVRALALAMKWLVPEPVPTVDEAIAGLGCQDEKAKALLKALKYI